MSFQAENGFWSKRARHTNTFTHLVRQIHHVSVQTYLVHVDLTRSANRGRRGMSASFEEMGLKPPSKSDVSLCWLKLRTINCAPTCQRMALMVGLAEKCTVSNWVQCLKKVHDAIKHSCQHLRCTLDQTQRGDRQGFVWESDGITRPQETENGESSNYPYTVC